MNNNLKKGSTKAALSEKSVVVDTKFVQDTELNRSENCAGSIPNEYSEGTADICIGQTEEYECIPENGEYALYDPMEMLRDDACLGTGISDMSSSGMDVDSGIVAENLSSGGPAECDPEQEALLAENLVGCDPEREERTADGDDAGTEIIDSSLSIQYTFPMWIQNDSEGFHSHGSIVSVP